MPNIEIGASEEAKWLHIISKQIIQLTGTVSAISGGGGGGTIISGTPNYIPKFNAFGNNIINSQIYDNGTNIGVGTTSPIVKLTVFDTSNTIVAAFGGESPSPNFVGIGSFNGAQDPLIQGYTSNFGGTTKICLNPVGGNVLIGTAIEGSTHKLQVNGSIKGTYFYSPTTNYGTIIAPFFDKALIGQTLNTEEASISFGNSGQDSNGTAIKFTVNSDGGPSIPVDAMFIRATGRVGIGTANPISRLNVEAPVNAVSGFPNMLNNSIAFFGGYNGSFSDYGIAFFNSAVNPTIHSYFNGSAVPLKINTYGGNILLGDAVDNTVDKLQVLGSAKFSIGGIGYVSLRASASSGLITATNNNPADPTIGASIGANFGYNDSVNNFYGSGLGSIRNGAFDMWWQTGAVNGGGYRWYIGIAEKMTLSNTGNLLINTIIDNNIHKLQVNGKILSTGATINGAIFNDNISGGQVINFGGGSTIYFGNPSITATTYEALTSHRWYVSNATRFEITGFAATFSDKLIVGKSAEITGAPSAVTLVLKQDAAPAGNIQEWQDSTGTVLAHVTSTGVIVGTSLVREGGLPNEFLNADGSVSTATTLGANLFGFANPGSTSFIRINPDNSVDALNASTFRAAIGAMGTVADPLTAFNDTNITLTLGGTPATALLQPVSITVGWTGTLADARIASASIWNNKQAALVGTGFVKSAAGVITYDTTVYYPSSNPAGYTTNTGTVTSVSVVTANGISGVVATPGTTPAITLTLGAITPTSTNGVSAAIMAFVDATSSIQTQLNNKPSLTGTGATGTWGINITGSAASLSANLPVNRLNSGTNASATTYWRGDGAWVNPFLSATAVLDFPNTGSGNSADLTIALVGAALGDVVLLGAPNGSVLAGSDYFAWVSAVNTVSVRFNNYGAGAKNPASGTFKVTIIK